MLYLICRMISSVYLACYGISCAKDWISGKRATITFILASYNNRIQYDFFLISFFFNSIDTYLNSRNESKISTILLIFVIA